MSVVFVDDGPVKIDAEWRADGVTAQFIDEAATYDERYFNSPYWEYLVRRGIDFAGVDVSAPLDVLDIGSGSGNTVFPLLKQLPNAKIAASDISSPLLKMLHRRLLSSGLSIKNVDLRCFDLHKDVFAPNTFDLIIGGAVLHHMIDPHAALANVAKWLRPSGCVVLYEPMEYGALIISVILQRCIDLMPSSPLSSLFQALKNDVEARLGVPKIKPWTGELDDKWYFNDTYLRTLSAALGFVSVDIFRNTDEMEQYFEKYITGLIHVSGNSHLEIPPSALAVIKEFDAGISVALKQKVQIEAIVIFRK